MKKIILTVTVIAAFVSTTVKAQSLIAVENSTSGSSFYKFLDQAITNAQAGDVIYLPGGSFAMGSARINKPLTIIGVGHHPDSTLATNQTIITGTIPIDEGAHNLHLEGLFVMGDISLTAQNQSDNVILRRCNVANVTTNGSHFSQFDNDTTFSNNWQISHNIIRGNLELGFFKNFTLSGNIVAGQLFNAFTGGIIENNVFLYNSQSTRFMDNVRNSTFKNNIFLQSWEMSWPGYACYNPPCGSFNNIFLNNSFCMGGQSLYLDNGIAAVSLNNKFDADPTSIFINAIGNVFSYANNYHLDATFTASILGSDATEIGIYGSSNPYKEGAVPMNPHIQTKTIAPSTTPNGLLNVNIKVGAQNN
jgi:hypothetical protein